jgi:hypothetical protein|tara:strand:+ start:23666 stop:23863 length:198 start_codon:yes stop_codon:yes gene_type:complete
VLGFFKKAQFVVFDKVILGIEPSWDILILIEVLGNKGVEDQKAAVRLITVAKTKGGLCNSDASWV